MNQVKWLWSNMDKPLQKRHIAALIISAVTSAMLLINPALSARLVDEVIIARNTAPLLPLLMWMLGFKLLREGLRFFMVISLEKSSQNVALNLRRDLFQKLQYQDLRFFNQNRTGDIMTRLSAPQIKDAPDTVSHSAMAGEIAFDHVSFQIDRQQILSDVSFSVEPGQALAIMGPTGSGKKTLINPLARFYDVNAGEVRIDGLNVKRWKLQELRSHIGTATQDVFLFSDTVDGNIAFGSPELRADEMKDFARRAAADGFVRSLSEGYDTLIGERGVGLSGGQRQRIALVGETGAGKSTIVNLLCRFYNLDGGRILLYGQADGQPYDISQVTLRSLRRQMGIMLQDSFLFSGTIQENIRYGRMDATDEEVREAAEAVQADGFIREMAKGYLTPVNERGSSLSQGQKQLISFARTLLSDPKILIPDEATSSIDTQTERLLQQGIQALLKGRTAFIIAHRLSTIKHCDRILYIGRKGIMEAGSHQELMEKKGFYYELYTAQARKQGLNL